VRAASASLREFWTANRTLTKDADAAARAYIREQLLADRRFSVSTSTCSAQDRHSVANRFYTFARTKVSPRTERYVVDAIESGLATDSNLEKARGRPRKAGY